MLICIPCISNLSDVIGTIWWLPTNHSKQWFLGHSLIRPNSSKRKQDDRSFDIDVPTIYLLVQNWALQWSRKILLTLLFFAVVLKMPLKLKQLTFQAQQKKKRKHSFLMMKIKRATTMWIQAWKEFKMQQAQQQGNERLLTWWAWVFFNIFLLVAAASIAMLGAQFPKAHLCSCILDAPLLSTMKLG